MAAASDADGDGTDTSHLVATTPLVGLLTIPQELRDEIHMYLLEDRDNIPLCCNVRPMRSRENVRDYLALSLTCRQVHHEAVAIFFGRNDFRIGVWGVMRNVHEQHLGLTKDITFQSASFKQRAMGNLNGNATISVKIHTEGEVTDVKAVARYKRHQTTETPAQRDIISRMEEASRPVEKMLQRLLRQGDARGCEKAVMQSVQLMTDWHRWLQSSNHHNKHGPRGSQGC